MRIVLFLIVLVAIGAGTFFVRNNTGTEIINSTPTSTPDQDREDIEIIAEDLQIPWEIAFLPDGDILVTERPGKLLRIGDDRQAIEVSGVRHVGEGGLMGLALHPDFEDNHLIYLYLTSQEGNRTVNRVERYKLEGNTLSGRQVIIEGIPGSAIHDGGRIEFGPDGMLYIGTGDAGNENSAQDRNSLAGKILRINDDGSIPSDNPFGNAVYSYGHRNVQGLTWDNEDRLWATEHGPSGALTGYDELNLIERGQNYGWPLIRGDQQRNGMISPKIQSGGNETWAPGDAEFVNGSIFFSGLRGATLYEAKLSNTEVSDIVRHLANEYGRLRAVRLGPDGGLYITTSNTDGRGNTKDGDDKIIRLEISRFQ